MIKKKHQRKLALLCSVIFSISTLIQYKAPMMNSYAYTVRSATVQASALNVRNGPGTSYTSITKLGKGTSVSVIGEKSASDGALWYEIRFTGSNGQTQTGYVSKSYVKFPVSYTTDQSFESYLTAQRFPESYKDGLRQLHAQYPNWVFTAQHTNLDWETVIQNESIVGRSLVQRSSVSSWKSTADGAYNWDSSTWPGFDGNGWVAASDGLVRHYIDPRNFLDDTYIFQFLLHSYDGSKHTREGLGHILQGTFLAGATTSDQTQTNQSAGSSSGSNNSSNSSSSGNSTSGGEIGPGMGLNNNSGTKPDGASSSSDSNRPDQNTGEVSLEGPQASISLNEKYYLMSSSVTTGYGPGMNMGGQTSSESSGSTSGGTISGASAYTEMIMNAASQTGVNPYVLAAMLIQEQGRQGTSGLISGRYSGYVGYYNYFNIEAYQSGSMSATQRGLWYASQSGSYLRPWTSPEKSILGGATFYAENYVKAGQDTFYLKKFNVQGSNLYKHQYMTNVQGAASEAALYAQAYNDQLRSSALEFKIPVYLNMPETASALPLLDGSPNNKLSSLNVDGHSLTPTFQRDTTSYDLIVSSDTSQIQVNASAIDSGATIQGGGKISLTNGNNQLTIAVTAKNGTVKNYVINVVRQGGATGGGNGGQTQGSGSSSGTSIGPGYGSTSPNQSQSSGETSTGISTPGGSNVTIIQ